MAQPFFQAPRWSGPAVKVDAPFARVSPWFWWAAYVVGLWFLRELGYLTLDTQRGLAPIWPASARSIISCHVTP